MNRKEAACGAVGVMLSAVGCAPLRSSALPVGGVEQGASSKRNASPNEKFPHVTEMFLSLISGTTRDTSRAIISLAPKSGWSIASDRSKLRVSIVDGDAHLEAPQHEKVQLIARATISHVDGTSFLVRCHIEVECEDTRREAASR